MINSLNLLQSLKSFSYHCQFQSASAAINKTHVTCVDFNWSKFTTMTAVIMLLAALEASFISLISGKGKDTDLSLGARGNIACMD